MLTLDLQLYAVIVMFLTGVALGVVFDIYRGLRSALSPGPVATGVGDLLFWAIGTMILVAALLFGTWGEVRLFVPVGIASGLFVYRALARRSVARATKRTLMVIAGAVHTLISLVRDGATVALAVAVSVLRIIVWPARLVIGQFARPARWLVKRVAHLLSPLSRLRRRVLEALRRLRNGPPNVPPPEL